MDFGMGIGRGGAAVAWACGSPKAWFLLFWQWEDKNTAMGYAKDFQDPQVLGNLILPWPGEGNKLEFRDLAASHVWAGVQFASERGEGGARRGRPLTQTPLSLLGTGNICAPLGLGISLCGSGSSG